MANNNKKLFIVFFIGVFLGIIFYKTVSLIITYKKSISTPVLSSPLKRQRKFNLLVFNTMPKSGSVYIAKLISQSTGAEWKSIGNPYFPVSTMDYFMIKELAIGKTLSLTQEHFNPSSINMQMIQKFCDRMILHVRHPLQATLSWIHNMDEHKRNKREDLLYYVAPTPPQEIYKKTMSQKIDWYIENYLPTLNEWLLEWMNFLKKNDPSKFKILVTHFEEFKKDEQRFLEKVLDFYEIDSQSYQYKPPQKNIKSHFRRGKIDEWKTVFSPQQIRRAKAKLDPRVMSYFNWDI